MGKKIIKVPFGLKLRYGSILLPVLALLVLISQCSYVAKAAPDSVIALTPTSTTIDAGTDFVLNAGITPNTNAVTAVSLKINYDGTKMSLTSIVPTADFATILSATGPNPTGIIFTNPSASNASAVIDFGVPNGIAAVTGAINFNVATLTFHAISAVSNSPIAFNSATGASAEGEMSNVLITKTGAQVTILAISDIIPPVLSGGTPSGTLAAGTTQTTIAFNTDENSTCKYSTTAGILYDSMPNTIVDAGGTTHSVIVNNLANGSSYAYYVRCQDSATSPNANTSDYVISFGVGVPAVVTSSSHHSSKKSTPSRSISHSKNKIKNGDILMQRGKKFSKKSLVLMYFSKPSGGYYPPARVMTSATGSFVVSYRVNKAKGKYGWYVVDLKTGKKSKLIYYTVK